MAAPLVLYRSFHSEDAEGWHYVYTTEKQYQNFKSDGPTFYAYTTQQPGTVPIYRDHAGSPPRYRFTADAQPGQGWQRDPQPAFYAYPSIRNKAQPAGTVPVYTFHAVGTEGWRYSYTTEPLWGVNWIYDGVDFYAPVPPATVHNTRPLYNKPPSIQQVPDQDEFQLGWGVNVATGALGAFAVKGIQTNTWNDFREDRNIRIFSSSSDIEDAVGRFTHTQAFVLGASLSASADFLFSTSVNDLSLSIEADTTVQTRIEAINLGHTPQLDTDALNLLKRDPAGFINRYGTHFIGGFIYGGYFTGAINLRSHSVADRAHLTADLQKSINLWHAGASTTSQFKADLASTHVQYELEARAEISGRPATTNISDPDALIAEVDTYASQLATSQGNRVIAVCYTWDLLPEVVQVLNGLPQDKRKLFQPSIQPDVVQSLARELASLNYLANTVKALSAAGGQTTTQTTVLNQSSGDINAAITKIKGLSIDGLAKLDVNSVKQFQAAAAIRQKLSATSLVTA